MRTVHQHMHMQQMLMMKKIRIKVLGRKVRLVAAPDKCNEVVPLD